MKNLRFLKTLTAGVALALAIYPQAWALKTNLGTIDDSALENAQMSQDGDNLVVDAGNGVTYSGKMNGDTFVIETRTITKTSEIRYNPEWEGDAEYGPKYESIITTYNSSGQEIRNVVSSTTDAQMGVGREAWNYTSVYNGAINANNLVSYTVDDHDLPAMYSYENGKLEGIDSQLTIVNGIPILMRNKVPTVDGAGIHGYNYNTNGEISGSTTIPTETLMPGSFLTDAQYVQVATGLGEDNIMNHALTMFSQKGINPQSETAAYELVKSELMSQLSNQTLYNALIPILQTSPEMVQNIMNDGEMMAFLESNLYTSVKNLSSEYQALLQEAYSPVLDALLSNLSNEDILGIGERLVVADMLKDNPMLYDNALGIDRATAQTAYVNQITGDMIAMKNGADTLQASYFVASADENEASGDSGASGTGSGTNTGTGVETPTVPKAKRTYYTIEEAMGHLNHTNNNRVIFTFK